MPKGGSRSSWMPSDKDYVGAVWEKGQVVRQLGPRQGTIVCAPTIVDMKQCNHELIPPFSKRWLTCGKGRIPSDTLVC